MAKFSMGTAKNELVVYVVQAEPLQAAPAVLHDSSFVTQLIADAADLPSVPKRRRNDREGPLAAYTSEPKHLGRTRRIA